MKSDLSSTTGLDSALATGSDVDSTIGLDSSSDAGSTTGSDCDSNAIGFLILDFKIVSIFCRLVGLKL